MQAKGGLFHLPENTFLKKVLQKRLNTKIFISDKPEFCGAIGAGLFAVDSDRLLERLECNALNINPKNLVILFGTNDIGIGVPTEYTLKNIKESCKSVAKTVARKVPNPERRINTGFFGTSKPKGTTPTQLFRVVWM